MTAERVAAQPLLRPRGQPVKALCACRYAAHQVDTHIAGNTNHDSADNTCRNATASTAPVSRSFTPEGSSTSIAPLAGRSTVGLAGAGWIPAMIEASCPSPARPPSPAQTQSARRCETADAKCKAGHC